MQEEGAAAAEEPEKVLNRAAKRAAAKDSKKTTSEPCLSSHLKTSNLKTQTSSLKHQTSNIKHQTSNLTHTQAHSHSASTSFSLDPSRWCTGSGSHRPIIGLQWDWRLIGLSVCYGRRRSQDDDTVCWRDPPELYPGQTGQTGRQGVRRLGALHTLQRP